MSERALPLGRSSWRALPAIALAALLPKCPVCLFGLLAAVGATGIQDRLAACLDARVIFASTIMALACATAWLAASRGLIGGAVAAFAAILIVCGKHVFFSPALVVAGVATLLIYLGFGPVVSRMLARGSGGATPSPGRPCCGPQAQPPVSAGVYAGSPDSGSWRTARCVLSARGRTC